MVQGTSDVGVQPVEASEDLVEARVALCCRLDLTKQETPEKIEKDLIKLLPRERWISFSHQLIHLGRGPCVARKPKCAACGLINLCYAKDKTA